MPTGRLHGLGIGPGDPELLSLSRLNYQWPACEVHPEIMESVAARPLCLQRSLKGWNEVLQLVHSPTDNRQERGRAGLRASARSPSQRGGFLASETSQTINRDKTHLCCEPSRCCGKPGGAASCSSG